MNYSEKESQVNLEYTSHSSEKNLEILFKNTNTDMKICIQNCLECARACEHVIQHCLKKGGLHSNPDHIRLLQDCADICRTSAQFMTRKSNFHHDTCGICAEICQACAKDCESMADDEMMKICGEICLRCAESCKKMSSMH